MKTKITNELAKYFTSAAANHLALAKCHTAALAGHEAGTTEHLFHKIASESHLSLGETCAAAAKTFDGTSKAFGLDDPDLLEDLPAGLAVNHGGTPRAVVRAGQREIPTGDEVKIPFGLEKVAPLPTEEEQ